VREPGKKADRQCGNEHIREWCVDSHTVDNISWLFRSVSGQDATSEYVVEESPNNGGKENGLLIHKGHI